MSKLGVGGLVTYFASRLRFPQLFWITAILFLADMFLLDPIPFVDEALLGLMTVLLGSLKKRSEGEDENPVIKNVTPPDP